MNEQSSLSSLFLKGHLMCKSTPRHIQIILTKLISLADSHELAAGLVSK